MNYYFYIIFKLEKLKAPVAQWIRCFPPKEKIPGSSPGRGGFFGLISFILKIKSKIKEISYYF